MIEIDFQTLLPQLASAVAILLVGLLVAGIAARLVRRVMVKASVDAGLTSFVRSLVKATLSILAIIAAASTAGIQMTSFIALLGAAGLAVGLAFQGALSNFAGGILILATRPFSVGQFVEAGGHMGTVQEIQVLYTILDTPDNRRVVVPNASLANTAVINYSVNALRRVDLQLGISYDADISTALEAVRSVLAKHPHVLDDPAPVVGVSGHGASSIDLLARFWTPREQFLTVQHELYQQIKERLDREGIGIPFPQRDVRIISQENPA
ncbi:MAG: mechanosensitive ion channel family protein [Alkalispirochaeta sp.]